jgi:hypothetical protein
VCVFKALAVLNSKLDSTITQNPNLFIHTSKNVEGVLPKHIGDKNTFSRKKCVKLWRCFVFKFSSMRFEILGPVFYSIYTAVSVTAELEILKFDPGR